MPRRRSRYRQLYAHEPLCPLCNGYLSRLGGERFFLCSEGPSEKSRNRYSRFVWSGSQASCDPNAWLEEFFCADDGRQWMAVQRTADGRLQVSAPEPSLWKRAIGVTAIDRNPSVSEFSWRSSQPLKSP